MGKILPIPTIEQEFGTQKRAQVKSGKDGKPELD